MTNKSEKRYQILANVIMAVISLCAFIPFLLLVMSSLSSDESIITSGYSIIPKEFSLEAYAYIWNEKAQIFRAYGVTILVTVIGTVCGLILTILYAYALSKPAFPGKTFFSFYIFFTMLFNGGLVPTYIMYTNYFNIKNTIPALIIPSLLFQAFNVILVRTYIQGNVPEALSEAAQIDGASEYRIFASIAVPLSKPIIATVALFIGVAYWNDWTNGLYYITNNQLYSIQQLLTNMMKNLEYLSNNALSSSMGEAAARIPQTTVRMAIAVIGILPIIVIYPFIQKNFVKGIAIGSVKG